jgi:hypothetical protein
VFPATLRFADGSVRFLKDTIDTWPYDQKPGLPVGVTVDPDGPYKIAPGVRFDTYQAVSTRNGGEVLSADGPLPTEKAFVVVHRYNRVKK